MIESSRIQWEDARSRLLSERDPLRQAQLLELVDAVLAQLRRELGSVFSLGELDDLYLSAESWVTGLVCDYVSEKKSGIGHSDTTFIQDAAFDFYARGAYDYEP